MSLGDHVVFWFHGVYCWLAERPLHFLERVLDVTLRWTNWPQEFCQDSYLCVKNNYIYEKVALVVRTHTYRIKMVRTAGAKQSDQS